MYVSCIRTHSLTWSIACIEKLNVMNSQMGRNPAYTNDVK